MRSLKLAAICLFAAVTAPKAETTVLSIASGAWAPFSGQDLPGEGIVNSSVRRIATAAGYDVEFNYMPWARALEETRQGAYDATSYWFYKAEREDDFIHIGPLNEERTVFYALASTDVPEWTDLSDLAGLRIGVITGYTYTPELWELGAAGVLSLSEAQSDEANFRKLLAGRVDLLVISQDVGNYLLNKSFSEADRNRLTIVEKPLSTAHGYLLLPRNKPETEAIANAMQNVIETEQSRYQQ